MYCIMEVDFFGGKRVAESQGNEADAAISGCVLIVDDNPGVVRLLQLMLERAGYETMLAYSGPEALERLE